MSEIVRNVLCMDMRKLCISFLSTLTGPAPVSKLFPYTTLFRSGRVARLLIQKSVDVRFQLEKQHPDGIHLGQLETDIKDRKSTRLNSSHGYISYAVFCLKKKNNQRRKEKQLPANALGIRTLRDA